MNFSLRVHVSFTRFVYTKKVRTHENFFSSKTLKLLKAQQKKRYVNDENANAESVLYQAWSTTKVGVDLKITMVEKKLVFLVLLLYCLILLQQVNQAIMEDYRFRYYQWKLLFSQIVDITQKLYFTVAPYELLLVLVVFLATQESPWKVARTRV